MNLKTNILKFCALFFSLILPFLVSSQKEKAFEINRKLGRGINYGNMLEAPTETGWGNPWQPEYPGMISQLGFNHVRIPVRWEPADRSMETPPYTINPAFLNRVKQVVDSTLAKGLYAIINMHHHDTLCLYPAAQRARFLAQWEQISDFFKNYPDSLLFEILNEPHGNMDAGIWNSFLVDALGKIRIKNSGRIVLIGVAEYGGLGGLSKLQLPNDPNIILTVHYYNPFHFTHQGAGWAAGSDAWLGTKWSDSEQERNVVRQEFESLRLFSQQKNIPVHIGEFGAYSKADLDSRGRWTTFLARYFEEQNWSWAYWEFCAGFGIYDPATKLYNPTLINALLVNKMPEPAQFETKQIYQSDFLYGTDGWLLYRQGTAIAQISNNSAKLNIQITNGGAETWYVQLVKYPVSLYDRKKYQVSFTAKASEPRSLNFYTGMSVSPWSAYSDYITLSITDSLKEYSYVFDMDTTDLYSRIVFDLGKSAADVIISEVKLEELTLKNTSSTLIENNLHISPNPVKTSFMMTGIENIFSVSIYTLSGHKVFELYKPISSSVNISRLESGIYILNIGDGNRNYTYKVIKQ
jgi:endoglucanase